LRDLPELTANVEVPSVRFTTASENVRRFEGRFDRGALKFSLFSRENSSAAALSPI
jgi:hypothetical protein